MAINDSKKLLNIQVANLAMDNGYAIYNLMAVIKVESGGIGFAADGKIIIQFEPSWFKRKSPYTPSGLWSQNGVERQALEWQAFNSAFALNPNAAMESTSIGLMQVMGFHWKLLGFKSVGEMWDYAKVSEWNQLEIAIRFIKSNKKLDNALKTGDAATFAYYYNGSLYKKFKYDTRLIAAGMKKV
ncbi:MAG: N-acetylmuramidase family protein [Bacteroidota bacterium]